jgi:prepilin-type processing-associated H-X9-DG protein
LAAQSVAGNGSNHVYDDKRGSGTWHGGAHVAFVDGSVRFVPDNLPKATLRSLPTTTNEANVDVDRLGMTRLNQAPAPVITLTTRLAGAVVLLVSVAHLVRERRKLRIRNLAKA